MNNPALGSPDRTVPLFRMLDLRRIRILGSGHTGASV